MTSSTCFEKGAICFPLSQKPWLAMKRVDELSFFWGGRGIFVHQVSDELHTKVIFTFEAVEWVSEWQSVSIGIGNDVVDQ